jgi:cell division protease FtsH
MMARAVAGEAGAPFYAVSGSDFVQMYVGVGAGRVRELFAAARKNAKAVIFIDEIDALAKKRGSAGFGGNDEREQTLNALLTEMSGFKPDEGIVVIAATNRIDTLDEAILRPGRFDRIIEIALPDRAGREKILRLHAANKPLADDVDLSETARQTVYFSGAMLENLLNEAAIRAAKDASGEITDKHINAAYYDILAGSEKKDRAEINEKDREITAFHEAGHAVVTRLALPRSRIKKISVIPSAKGYGGFCASVPEDRMFMTKGELRARIKAALGGRAAEELIFGGDGITTGAANDIEKATQTARDYIAKYGMSEAFGMLNAVALDAEGPLYDECLKLINRMYSETKRLLSDNMTALNRLAGELISRESLNEREIDEIFAGVEMINEVVAAG